MEKSFFEVFPQLKLDTEMSGMLKDTVISKVSTTSRQDFLRVYMTSRRLLAKDKILFLERELKNQLFPNHELTIKIIEKFYLSEQYTLQNLMDVYWDSILTEFRNYSLVEYNILRKAKLSFPEEGVLLLTLEDSVLARQMEDEIYHILEKILNERCNLGARIEMDYYEKEDSRYRKNADIQIQNEVKNIIRLSSFGTKKNPEGEYLGSEETSDVPWETQSEKTVSPKPAAKAEKAKQEKSEKSSGGWKAERKSGADSKGGYREKGAFRRSENPDVIFGRDFEEETIPIEQIMGEMGEVVIRGQVRSLEQREIRNEKTILMFAMTDFTDTIMVKMFCKNEYLPEILEGVRKGAFLKIKGVTTIDRFDSELTIGSVNGIKKIPSLDRKSVV